MYCSRQHLLPRQTSLVKISPKSHSGSSGGCPMSKTRFLSKHALNRGKMSGPRVLSMDPAECECASWCLRSSIPVLGAIIWLVELCVVQNCSRDCIASASFNACLFFNRPNSAGCPRLERTKGHTWLDPAKPSYEAIGCAEVLVCQRKRIERFALLLWLPRCGKQPGRCRHHAQSICS